jgi:hypothetical protein
LQPPSTNAQASATPNAREAEAKIRTKRAEHSRAALAERNAVTFYVTGVPCGPAVTPIVTLLRPRMPTREKRESSLNHALFSSTSPYRTPWHERC